MYSLRRIHTLSRIDFIVFLYYLYGVICLFIHKIPLSSCYIYKWGLFPVKIENTKTLKYRTEAKEYLQNNTI